MCQQLWDHYAFDRDLQYLQSVYPTIKGAAEFWLANLVESGDGKLITSPSTSPENTFTTDDGVTSTITEGGAMDRELVWDLFDNTIQACAALKVDQPFAEQLTAARDRIAPLKIGKGGQLMEWNGDWDLNAKDIHHRHISHLFALHPGHQITLMGTPQLASAAKETLKLRGDDGTGWSLAWKINCWARLHDGDHAHALMDYQLRYTTVTKTIMADAGGTYPNLFDAHPPFQIDGNFGFISGVDEMLLQSQERYHDSDSPGSDRYFIDLLPALPASWADGMVSGLCARGGFEIGLAWKSGHLANATVKSVGGTTARVRYGDKVVPISLVPGGSCTFDEQFQLKQ